MARLRHQRQPSTPIAMGRRNAAKPKTWNSRSEAYAPTGPIQLLITPPSDGCALTLNEASRGEYEIRAREINTPSEIHKNPTNSFSRLFSVGVRKRTRSPQLLGKAECGSGCWRYRNPAWKNAQTKMMIPNTSRYTTNTLSVRVCR